MGLLLCCTTGATIVTASFVALVACMMLLFSVNPNHVSSVVIASPITAKMSSSFCIHHDVSCAHIAVGNNNTHPAIIV